MKKVYNHLFWNYLYINKTVELIKNDFYFIFI